ncbi:MAG: aspartate--tRNA ligase [Bacteroidales bacterium]|jgi:aspartyl-tRNA synthetase|nr:aspartate--tRNA ligase [Bacteroidales bacterium]
MLRTHNCGELRLENQGERVILCGWLHRSRILGGMTFIDIRDRYGVTQLAFDEQKNADLCMKVRSLGREFVLQAEGIVRERSSKNIKLVTGDIEIEVTDIKILNHSKTPPFTIEDNTDGGDELRMRYRYLDLRRNVLKTNLELRHRLSFLIRNYMNENGFMEIETPFLVKSTPEGARDFVVPSRMNANQFYALPQSPQTFKQLLMVAGYDRYFQLVRCFRDEDLRADRQPEFTQLDCEMSFVEQEDVLQMFEGLMKYLFEKEKGLSFGDFQRITWENAMKYYGSDKPDIRFDMKFVELDCEVKGFGFKIFDDAELIVGICAANCADYSRKQIDELTEFVKRPQVGGNGLIYIRYGEDGIKSSIDKFFNAEQLKAIAQKFNAKTGDLMLIMAGNKAKTRTALSCLRLELGSRLGLRCGNAFAPLWVTDFPLLEWDEETARYYAMHHPFTAPKPEDYSKLFTHPAEVRANAYDLVVNGVELGGGSIRIHNREMQNDMFKALGFSEEEAKTQFGFLLDAFEYGAPPHGGIAFGFDRICSVFSGAESIRDFIAFPKNNNGRDIMLDAPANISSVQLEELNIKLK